MYSAHSVTRSTLLMISTTIALTLWPAGAMAQDTVSEQRLAEIEGAVKTSVGGAVAGAAVVLRQQSAPRPVVSMTDTQGHFVFLKLDAGVYTIAAQKDGWRPSAAQAIALGNGENKRIDLILESSSVNRNQSGNGVGADDAAGMQFSDAPNFTVAGVTDYSGAGGHGSETGLRTSEALTREALALQSTMPPDSSPQDARALELEREHLRKMIAAGEKAELYKQLGDIDERLHDAVAAVHEYQQATRLQPGEDNYFAWGTELLLHRAAQPAAEVFKKGVASYPKSAKMLAGYAAALYAAGSHEEAARRFCEASDLDPARAEIYEFFGEIEKTSTAPMPDCVQQKLSRFLHDQPNNAHANYNYALALWKQNRETAEESSFQQASRLLERAVAIDPKFGEAHLQLGIMRAARSEFAKAIDSYKAALAVAPDLADAHYRLGLAYRRVGEQSKAQEEFQKYQQMQAIENAQVERDRHELRQFLIVMKEQPSVAH